MGYAMVILTCGNVEVCKNGDADIQTVSARRKSIEKTLIWLLNEGELSKSERDVTPLHLLVKPLNCARMRMPTTKRSKRPERASKRLI